MKHLPILFLAIFFSACSDRDDSSIDIPENIVDNNLEFYGNTQGTTFAILCNDPIEISMREINEILADFDTALSSYIPESIVSKLNNYPAGEYNYNDKFGYFNRCYQLSQQVFDLTTGDFDPTVFPLVDGWGFMKDVTNVPDSITIDSLKALVGFQNDYHFSFLGENEENKISKIIKNTPHSKLDFNAIAQGLAVDILGEEFERRGAKNYFIEIGGEIRVSGVNSEDVLWRIGIDQPIANSTSENRELQEIVQLDNRSIATSGSYRKFYEKNGVKYSHTLNPKTGYPVKHNLLSATVIADNCALADAMATAFMVMGVEKTIDFLKQHSNLNLEVYLIFVNAEGKNETYISKGFEKMIN